VVSILSIAAGLAIAGWIGFFYLRSDIVGGRLVAAARQAEKDASKGLPGSCGSLHSGVEGLLEAPSIGLVAPVLQGTSNPVLDVAVGHDPASTWPGDTGTAVFAAHDVTWFSGIDHLTTGALLRWVTPCTTTLFRVVRHAVVPTGYPVHESLTGRVVLVTCYPLNALYLTPTRYLVYADYVGEARTQPRWTRGVPLSPEAPRVPAPAALAAQGLGLSQNDAPLGVLTFAGSPSQSWAQSANPIDDERAALHEYFGLLKAAGQEQPPWWQDLAPTVPTAAAGPLWGGTITHYDHALEITLDAQGTELLGAQFSAVVTVVDQGGTAVASLHVTESVDQGTLQVTSVTVSE